VAHINCAQALKQLKKRRRIRDIVAGTVGSDSDANANDSDCSVPLARPASHPRRALRQDVDVPGGVGVAGIASKRPRLRNANATRLYAQEVQRPKATHSAPVAQLKATQLRQSPTPLDTKRLEQMRQALAERAGHVAALTVQAAPVPAFRNLRQIVRASPARVRFRGLGGVSGGHLTAGKAKCPAVLDITATSSENLFLRALLGSDVAAVFKPCAPCWLCCATALVCVN
jgi:hypothetical protein